MHAQRGLRYLVMCGLERLFVLKILSCTQRATEVKKICGVFFETAPFKSYGVKRKLKSQLLIRSSLAAPAVTA